LQNNSTTRILLNTGDNTFNESHAYELPEYLYFKSRSQSGLIEHVDQGVRFGDINGDGLPDLLRSFMGYEQYYQKIPKGSWKVIQKVYLNTGTTFEESDTWKIPSSVYFVETGFKGGVYIKKTSAFLSDINGDGLMDIIKDGGVYYNTGEGWESAVGISLPLKLTVNTSPTGGTYKMQDSGARLMDINGDGLIDLIQKTGGNISHLSNKEEIYINTGYGYEKDSTKNIPTSITNYELKNLSRPGENGLLEIVAQGQGVQFADINNDGMQDVIKSTLRVDLDTSSTDGVMKQTTEVYLNQTPKPELLTMIKNGIGGKTKINYQLSSTYQDATGTNANKKLPLNLWTVNKLEVWDGVTETPQIIEYEYAGGKYRSTPIHEQGFAGFKEVTKRYMTGGIEKTEYYQELPVNGRIKEQNIYDDQGQKKTKINYRYEIIEPNNPEPENINNEHTRQYAQLKSMITTHYEGGHQYKTGQKYYYEVEYGLKIKTIDYGEVSNTDEQELLDLPPPALEPYGGVVFPVTDDTIITEYKYTYNKPKNIIGAITEDFIKNTDDEILRHNRYYYDHQELEGINIGNLTRVEQELPETTRYQGIEYTYNQYGQVLQMIDALGNTTEMEYDNKNRNITAMITPNQHRIEIIYDDSTGKILEMINVNKVRTQYKYDGLGRLLQVKKPDPQTGEMLISHAIKYDLENIPASVITQTRNSEGEYKTMKTYYDGLSRAIQIQMQTEEGRILKDVLYDDKGQKIYESMPYFQVNENIIQSSENIMDYEVLTDVDDQYTNIGGLKYEYDSLGRLLKTSTKIGDTTQIYEGLKHSVINAKHQISDQEYDTRGRLITQTRYLNGLLVETKYEYDLLGNLIKLIDDQGNYRKFTYDELGRMVISSDWTRSSKSIPDTQWKYKYDELGRVIEIIDPKQQVFQNEYDAVGNIIKNITPDEEIMYLYNDKGQLAEVVTLDFITNKEQHKTQYKYDKLGQVQEAQEWINGNQYTVITTTNVNGVPLKIKYPDGSEVFYNYTEYDELKQVEYTDKTGKKNEYCDGY